MSCPLCGMPAEMVDIGGHGQVVGCKCVAPGRFIAAAVFLEDDDWRTRWDDAEERRVARLRENRSAVTRAHKNARRLSRGAGPLRGR